VGECFHIDNLGGEWIRDEKNKVSEDREVRVLSENKLLFLMQLASFKQLMLMEIEL